MTEKLELKHTHELNGLSLGRLASAIRSAARDEDWTIADPAALLQANYIGDPALTAYATQAIAQGFVYRLLDFFAAEAPGPVTRTE